MKNLNYLSLMKNSLPAMVNLNQSNEYDIVPSAMRKGYMNYTTELITADYAFSESILNKVDKSCRKHGIINSVELDIDK